jgi:predicted DNA-binding antitoxin AbrB/MazE fold protein
MMAAIKVHIIYENGKLRLLEPLELQEGQVLEATVLESPPQEEKKQERIFDMHAGNYWMSDDFDDELPDSFWLGEDE